ncbi:MAG: hypothetical protein PQ612_09650 [Rickettsiales bacterium]|nr:hypothetical protein [Pseudomonadota bacterium]MDA0966057.1 hypothetical protein [Pseudomonadota bacterium]MDG4544239.1 hypothetical protein [Rickettsiales bacterium]MDG4546418.1 hypothetical protein [Rickettsiales bacterium]MDG4548564.1 hypothetical protein [Rickettsiales bacterium]
MGISLTEQDNNYSMAYWQRACSQADLGNFSDAIDDLENYINLSSINITEKVLEEEPFFKELRKDERYRQMVTKYI